MADPVLHDNKTPALWITEDGVFNFLISLRVQKATAAFTLKTNDKSFGPDSFTTYSVPASPVNTQVLFYLRSRNLTFPLQIVTDEEEEEYEEEVETEEAVKTPAFYLVDGVPSLITFAKFPSVYHNSTDDSIMIIYWVNVPETGGTPAEPYDWEEEEVDDSLLRELRYTTGTPILALNSITDEEDTYYIFTEPKVLLTPENWNTEEDINEPVLDVHTSSGGSPPRWQDSP